MEHLHDYLSRKNRELDWLRARLRDPGPSTAATSVADVVSAKFDLRARLVAQVVADHPAMTETNSQPGPVQTLPPYALNYRYQRFDLSIDAPPVYPAETAGLPLIRGTLYASSGMGALAGVLLGLHHAPWAPSTLVGRSDMYFETQSLVREVTPKVAFDAVHPRDDLAARAAAAGGFTTVLVDSITARDDCDVFERLAPGTVDLLLFDTTCYPVGSDRIARALAAAIRLRAPVVLVRSHVKIDFLGVEYGRLGSSVFATSPMHPRPVIEWFRAFQQGVTRLSRLIGVGPVPYHLNPFHADPEFQGLNQARLDRLMENNRRGAARVAEALADLDVRVGTYHHDLFFTLGLMPDGDGAVDAVNRLIGDLVDHCRARDLEVRKANSFGFDFVALTHFRDLERLDGIRIALPDHPDEATDALLDAVIAWCRARLG